MSTDTCYDPFPDLGVWAVRIALAVHGEPSCKSTGADVGISLLRMHLLDDMGPAECAGGAPEPDAFHDFPVPTWDMLDCEPVPDPPSDAYLQGWAAYAAGVDFTANSHEVLGQELQDEECGEWAAGWEAAERAGVERLDCDDEPWEVGGGDCVGYTWDGADGYPGEPDDDESQCSQCGACSDLEADGRCTATQDATGEYSCAGDYLWWAYPTRVVDCDGLPALDVVAGYLPFAPTEGSDPDVGRIATFRNASGDTGFWFDPDDDDFDKGTSSIAFGASDIDGLPVHYGLDLNDRGVIYPDGSQERASRVVYWLSDGAVDEPVLPGLHILTPSGDCGGADA